ncbi:hypothetical protein KSP39_PZI013113 [Platanthera zijinensis]|uniref:Uncharacterized protein n=1 Tax=Platanthera zijinensis TaxID=2320716 RepID=A0AAP0BC21_9ASPA
MKKSASMGSLSSAAAHNFPSHPCSPSSDPAPREHAATASGYASDDPGHAHPMDRRRASQVPVRPAEVGEGRLAWNSSKFCYLQDTNPGCQPCPKPIDHVPALDGQLLLHSTLNESKNANKLHLCLHLNEASSSNPPPFAESNEEIQVTNLTLPLVPTFYPTLVPVPIPFWPTNLLHPMREEEMTENHEILKPTPILQKDIINADALVSMSMLSIGEGVVFSRMEPSALSIKLLEPSASRHSAFHMNMPISSPELNQNGGNVIHAV